MRSTRSTSTGGTRRTTPPRRRSLSADLVERVIAAFRADKKLATGQATFVIDSGPIQWVDGQMRMMPPKDGGAVCHYARLSLRAREQTEP
jgi:hypothetical protein